VRFREWSAGPALASPSITSSGSSSGQVILSQILMPLPQIPFPAGRGGEGLGDSEVVVVSSGLGWIFCPAWPPAGGGLHSGLLHDGTLFGEVVHRAYFWSGLFKHDWLQIWRNPVLILEDLIRSGLMPPLVASRVLHHLIVLATLEDALLAIVHTKGGTTVEVQKRYPIISTSTSFFLSDDLADDVAPPPFGLCHRRWTATSLLLILRFDGGGPSRLSSVMDPQNLQLGSTKPQVHTPDRPLGVSPTGHQLVWSTLEAPLDCRCSYIEFVLSTDDRLLCDSIGNLRHRLCVRSFSFLLVQLRTSVFAWPVVVELCCTLLCIWFVS
jgi:hypothetical protein